MLSRRGLLPVEELLKRVSKHTSEELRLDNRGLVDNDAEEIARFLSQRPSRVPILSLCSNTLISNRGWDVIVESLRRNKTIWKLNLRGVHIKDSTIEKLAEILCGDNNTLKSLILRRTDVKDDGVKFISRALAANCQLTHLDLSDIFISPEAVDVLADALKVNRTLKSLLIEQGAFGNFSCLAESLVHNRTLETLSLSDNSPLSIEPLYKFFSLLSRNTSLTYLDLSALSSSICDSSHWHSACEALATFFKVNKTLTRLSLRAAAVDPSASIGIALALKCNTTLTHLDLSSNVLTCASPDVGIRLARNLRYNQGLKRLRLASCGLKQKHGWEFGEMLRENKTLLDLDLRRNSFSDGWYPLLNGVAENCGLMRLLLDERQFPSETRFCSAVQKILRINKTLKILHTRVHNPGRFGVTKMIQGLLPARTENTSLVELTLPFSMDELDFAVEWDKVSERNLHLYKRRLAKLVMETVDLTLGVATPPKEIFDLVVGFICGGVHYSVFSTALFDGNITL